MKRLIYIALLLFTVHCSLLTATAQSRTNRLYRPCAGSTTPATVAIAVDGSITATPCSGKQSLANVLTSYLTSTVTYNNNAVLANTPLSVNVAAGGTYEIALVIHSTSVTRALNLDFGGTSTQTNFIGEWEVHWAAPDMNTPDGWQGARVTAAGTDFGPTGSIDTNSNIYTFRGSVEVNAAGTFLVRGAQNVANASDTTILRGSVLKLTKLN